MLNESIVGDAALEWFGEMGYAVGRGPHLATGEPAAERQCFGAVVQEGRLRVAAPRSSASRRVPLYAQNTTAAWNPADSTRL